MNKKTPTPVEFTRSALIFLSLTGIMLSLLFAAINLSRDLPLLTAIQVATTLAYTLNLFYITRTDRLIVPSLIGFSLTVALLLLAAHFLGGNAIFWIYTLPLLAFFLFGLHGGMFANLVLLAVFGGFFWLHPLEFARMPFIQLDVLMSYFVVVAFAFLYEAQKKQHIAQLERLSETDPLTGACNRRRFYEILDDETERARRYGRRLSIVMFDVDDYKGINDKHGHGVGDAVLKQLARGVRRSIRASDYFVRYGGDEFVILAPDTAASTGEQIAHKLRHTIGQDTPASVPAVTLSVGITEYVPGETPDALMKRVDRALYKAKRGGKNRIVVKNRGSAAGSSPGMRAGRKSA